MRNYVTLHLAVIQLSVLFYLLVKEIFNSLYGTLIQFYFDYYTSNLIKAIAITLYSYIIQFSTINVGFKHEDSLQK